MKWPDDKQAIKLAVEADGFVVIDRFLEPDGVAEVLAQLDHYIQQTVPNLPPMDVFYQEKGDTSSIKMLSRMERHSSYFDNLLNQSRAQEIGSWLWSVPALGQDIAYFGKPPAIGEPTPPHQDGYYFHIEPCEAMTMWLALDEVDEANGCLRYVAGSHRQGLRAHGRTQTLGFSQGIADYGTPEDVANERPVCVGPGDLIVHDALTIHRAEGNHSPTRSRRALGLVYYSSRAQVDEDAKARYQAELSADLSRDGKI